MEFDPRHLITLLPLVFGGLYFVWLSVETKKKKDFDEYFYNEAPTVHGTKVYLVLMLLKQNLPMNYQELKKLSKLSNKDLRPMLKQLLESGIVVRDQYTVKNSKGVPCIGFNYSLREGFCHD